MIRNNICLNAHPEGCAAAVQRQIEYAKKNLSPAETAPKLALIAGCSNGYGLASRIAAAFGYGTATVGVSFENEPTEKRSGTPGFYNNAAFDSEAEKAGLVSVSLNGDAFSDEIKSKTAEALRQAAAKAGIPAKLDLFIYSLASPARTDPKTGAMYKSVIKPIGETINGKTLSMMDGSFSDFSVAAATGEEIAHTVKVMGGEDWEYWMEALDSGNLLSPNTRIIAYSYIGPEHSWAIYKNGTIGRAKEDLERAAAQINKTYAGKIAGAWVSINKALVTRSSAVIPVISLYMSCLFKVMKEMGLHEGCIEQIVRLYRSKLYAAADPTMVPVDSNGRIRVDDREMREDVQKAVTEKMKIITPENVFTETDVAGFKHDFLELHGFDIAGINYN